MRPAYPAVATNLYSKHQITVDPGGSNLVHIRKHFHIFNLMLFIWILNLMFKGAPWNPLWIRHWTILGFDIAIFSSVFDIWFYTNKTLLRLFVFRIARTNFSKIYLACQGYSEKTKPILPSFYSIFWMLIWWSLSVWNLTVKSFSGERP